jgi:hypothetical protein
MLSFAMDCWLAGIALCLLLGGIHEIFNWRKKDVKDFMWLSAAFGLSLLFLSRFLVAFAIVWSMWE